MRAARAGDAAGKRVEQRLRRRALPPGARNSPHELTRVNTGNVASKVHNAFILGNNWQHFEKDAFSQRNTHSRRSHFGSSLSWGCLAERVLSEKSINVGICSIPTL